MSISTLGSGLSGMQSFQRALDVSANNVANADTNGFQPQQADFQQNTGGVSVNVPPPLASPNPALANAPSATDLTLEMVNQLQYQTGFELSADVIKTANQMMGTLVDISV